MASYGRDYGRGAARGGRGRRAGAGRERGRYDFPRDGGWGTHLGESYVENYGSYATPLDKGSEPWRFGGGVDPRRGAPRGYGADYGHRPSRGPAGGYDRGFGRMRRARGYDDWRRGW